MTCDRIQEVMLKAKEEETDPDKWWDKAKELMTPEETQEVQDHMKTMKSHRSFTTVMISMWHSRRNKVRRVVK